MKGKRWQPTPKFGWTGKADETAVAWKGDDGDDESEDVDARVSSCSIDPFQRCKESETPNLTEIACKSIHTKYARASALQDVSSLTKLRLAVLWIKLGGWPPRGLKYSAISLCNLIFSSWATPSPRCGCFGLSAPLPLLPALPLLPFLEPDDLPHPMLSPKLFPLISPKRDLAGRLGRTRWTS